MFVNCVSLHMLQFKVAKNVVGDRRLNMRPENLKMNMFFKYNLRALNYSVESLQPVLETYRCSNSQKREGSDDDSTDSEDSDIYILERIRMMART